MPLARISMLPCIVLLIASQTGCTAPGSNAPPQTVETFDPLEDANRSISAFNQTVDRNVLVPVADAYRSLPQTIRHPVHNFLQNLGAPITFANDVLQAEPRLAADTLGRLGVNTTAGIGGFFDAASAMGIPYHANDLGITMARWGIPDGPYLIIPVLGPSNVRDLTGQVAESFADPGNIVARQHRLLWASFVRAGTERIDERSQKIDTLAAIERTSLDYYATIRSLYSQRRRAEIRHEQDIKPNPSQEGATTPAILYKPRK